VSWTGHLLPPNWTVSGSRLLLEVRAGWQHIGGQDVKLTLYRRSLTIVF